MSCFGRYAGICAPVWGRVGKFGFGFEVPRDHLVGCPTVPHALAVGLGRLGYPKRPGRSHHAPMETADRRRMALAYECTSGDRGGGCRPRAEPHAGTRAPHRRPHRLISDEVGVGAAAHPILAPRYYWKPSHCGPARQSIPRLTRLIRDRPHGQHDGRHQIKTPDRIRSKSMRNLH